MQGKCKSEAGFTLVRALLRACNREKKNTYRHKLRREKSSLSIYQFFSQIQLNKIARSKPKSSAVGFHFHTQDGKCLFQVLYFN